MAVEVLFGGVKPNPGDRSARVTFYVRESGHQQSVELTFDVPNPVSLDAAVRTARERLLAFAAALTETVQTQINQNTPPL